MSRQRTISLVVRNNQSTKLCGVASDVFSAGCPLYDRAVSCESNESLRGLYHGLRCRLYPPLVLQRGPAFPRADGGGAQHCATRGISADSVRGASVTEKPPRRPTALAVG